MLPLKAGVTIMALGAMSKCNQPVTIVTCGFNYFKVTYFFKDTQHNNRVINLEVKLLLKLENRIKFL